MCSSRGQNTNNLILVDPSSIDLDASLDEPQNNSDSVILVDPKSIDLEMAWITQSPLWERLVYGVITRLRHQRTVLAYGAILVALFNAGIRANHTEVLCTALVLISAIAIITEWIGGKN